MANVYLRYVFDLWAHVWRRQARGDVAVVRFADDIVMGLQYREEAERFLAELRGRFAKFGLKLHPKKTRLIDVWLPPARICHPYPLVRLGVTI